MVKKVKVITLGCAKNQIDSQRIKAYLCDWGFGLVEDERKADILILNTCGFIQPAKIESLDEIWRLGKLKAQGKKLVVCGCLAQRYSKPLVDEIPEIDGIFGISDIPRVGLVCQNVLKGKKIVLENPPEGRKILKYEKRIIENKTSAYLRIADGCDNLCSYCAIPLIRGKYRSKPIPQILKEAQDLSKLGVKEVNLVAQDITLYGKDIYKNKNLTSLLSVISKETKILWIRLLYTHPAHYNDELVDEISKNPKVCHYLDLPLQHVSNKILLKMGRKTTREKIEVLIEKLKGKIPDLTLRTTFMVGFPGETDKDFEELLEFIEETDFDWLGAFIYSKEEGTKAHFTGKQIPLKVIHERLDRLLLLQQDITFKKNKKKVGKTFKVLVEGKSKEKKGYYVGRSQYQAPEVDGVIFIKGKNLRTGDFVCVKITKAQEYDLIGKAIK